MWHRLFSVCIAGWATLLLVLPGWAQEFRWGLQAGETFDIAIQQTSTGVTVCNTISNTTTTSSRFELEWVIVSADSSEIQIRQLIRRVTMDLIPTTAGSPRIEIDTAKSESLRGLGGEIQKAIQALLGAEVLVSMSPRGEITQVTLPEALLESLRMASSSTPLRQLLTKEGLEGVFKQATFVFPEEALQPGHRWSKQETQLGPFGKQTFITDYEFIGEVSIDERPFQRFETSTRHDPALPASDNSGNAVANIADPPPELLGLQGDGVFLFDLKLGVFSQSNASTEVITKKQYRDLIIDTTLTNKTSMRIKKR